MLIWVAKIVVKGIGGMGSILIVDNMMQHHNFQPFLYLAYWQQRL
jgi:hypothetical protein